MKKTIAFNSPIETYEVEGREVNPLAAEIVRLAGLATACKPTRGSDHKLVLIISTAGDSHTVEIRRRMTLGFEIQIDIVKTSGQPQVWWSDTPRSEEALDDVRKAWQLVDNLIRQQQDRARDLERQKFAADIRKQD